VGVQGARGGARGHEGPGRIAVRRRGSILERAFERLSETSRSVVWLHDVEGYTHEEIAEQRARTVSFPNRSWAAGACAACGGCWMRREQHHVHCTDRRPLAVKENEASAWAKQHLGRARPAGPSSTPTVPAHSRRSRRAGAAAGRDRWPAVRAEFRVEQRRRQRRWGAWSLSAAAVSRCCSGSGRGRGGRVDAAELERVKQQSATLEASSSATTLTRRVTSGRTAALAAALEDRIAVIDGELAQVGTPQAPVRRAELVKLWQGARGRDATAHDVHVTRALTWAVRPPESI